MIRPDVFIQGGVFNETTCLKGLFSERMNIVFGRNGTGKSTIARAFREQQTKGKSQTQGQTLYKLANDDSGALHPDIRDKLLVFNEDFIDENVKFSNSGLKSIVTIGTSAQLSGPINDKRKEIARLNGEIGPLQSELDTLNGGSTGSVAEAEKQLKEGLKQGYMDRVNKIEGKQKLVQALIDPILDPKISGSDPSYSVAKETSELNDDINSYFSYKDGSIISWNTPDLSHLPDIDRINSLLQTIIKPSKLNDEERTILDDLSNALADEDFISKSQKFIVDEQRDYCPLCHQSITVEHREALKDSLLRFRDRNLKTFTYKVGAVAKAIPEISLALPQFNNNDYQKDLGNAETAINALNGFLAETKAALEKKVANPFIA
ncbi:MAG: AAA family ATPase, partial [Bacteroidales bacterium]|nr:AAA family ATPase [Bacteroidales bacterium]